jgi:hypothetical protein
MGKILNQEFTKKSWWQTSLVGFPLTFVEPSIDRESGVIHQTPTLYQFIGLKMYTHGQWTYYVFKMYHYSCH